jgi:hypothetical protein
VPPVPVPVTLPVPVIVAFPVVPLLHVPPVVASFNRDEVPGHNASVPVIGGGKALTVTVVVIEQPAPAV